MGDELTALRAIELGRDRDLVWAMRLALANAFDLGRVQRIDLPPALMLALFAHPSQRAHKSSSDKSCMCLRIDSPAVGSGGWPALSE